LGQITSGSSGINANNQATAILASANSTITVSASGSISSGTTLNNSGSQPSGILAGYLGGATATPNVNVNGTVIVNNAANITAAAGWGIDAYDFGSGNVTVNDASGTTVSGAQYGIAAYSESGGSGDVTINVSQNATIEGGSANGILGFSSGTGSISITTSPGDLITGPSGTTGSTGVNAVNQAASIPASSNSSIVVTTYGTINSGTALTGTGDPPAGITAGYLGGSTDPTSFPLTAINGSVVVNNFASITAAAGDGMRAYNYGIGNVTVFDDAGTITALDGASPTNGHGVGIGAYNYGTGSVSVSTAPGIVINSGGSGINAFNLAPSAPANSTVSVVAHGTITSGSIPTGNGSPAAGILAGYNFNGSPDNNVAGSLIIDDYASISAASGTDGIRGFNYGTGDITITAESGAVISGGRYGIAGIGHDGGNVQINNSATASGATAGVFAQSTGAAAISINNSSAGVIESSGTSSIPAISIVDDPTGSAVINNFGKIQASQNSAAGLAILETGSSVTINNSSSIVGDVNLSNAIINNNVGADWEFAGTNTFTSGVNIINNAGTINGQGTAGVIQISAGSLDIIGALSGTVDLAIGNAATLELNSPASAGETVTFLGAQAH
jgi:large repetitive protein